MLTINFILAPDFFFRSSVRWRSSAYLTDTYDVTAEEALLLPRARHRHFPLSSPIGSRHIYWFSFRWNLSHSLPFFSVFWMSILKFVFVLQINRSLLLLTRRPLSSPRWVTSIKRPPRPVTAPLPRQPPFQHAFPPRLPTCYHLRLHAHCRLTTKMDAATEIPFWAIQKWWKGPLVGGMEMGMVHKV